MAQTIRVHRQPKDMPSRRYKLRLTTVSGEVTIHIPKLKGIKKFITIVIECSRGHEKNVEKKR